MVKNLLNGSWVEDGESLFADAAAAMLYSDEEIKEVLSPVAAEEFIAMRDTAVGKEQPMEYFIGDEDMLGLMAAEDDEDGYGNQLG